MRQRTRAVLVVAAMAMAAPATAFATPSISVENGAIRYVGDENDDEFDIWPVENGEQWVSVPLSATIGPGCRDGHPPPTHGKYGTVLCTRDGVDRIEFVGGDGDDYFVGTTSSGMLPVHADLGAGWDRFDAEGTQDNFVKAGPGRDTYIDSAGNDTVDLGQGDDVFAAGPYTGGDDTIRGGSGADTLNGGPGDDTLNGGPGRDSLYGGNGNDALNSVDGASDGPITCGEGFDALWSDALDPVAPDCDLQDDRSTVKLTAPGVLPVAVPCAAGRCKGKLTVYAAPHVTRPVSTRPPPLTAPATRGKPLATARFRLAARATRTLHVKLGKAAAKRLKGLGRTTLVARVTFSQGGSTYTVWRTFGVKRT